MRLALAPGWNRSIGNNHGGLAKRVNDVLADAIVCHLLPPGTHLSEEAVAEALGISRTPVREALRQLANDYLVEIQPNRGAHVTELKASDAVDIYICRAYLYGLAAKMAAAVASTDELAQMNALIAELGAAARSRNVHGYFEWNLRFHDLVVRSAGNKMLLGMTRNLGQTTLRFRYLSLTIPGRIEESMDYHEQLIAYLNARNGEHAEKVVHGLIRSAGQAVLQSYFTSVEQDMTEALQGHIDRLNLFLEMPANCGVQTIV